MHQILCLFYTIATNIHIQTSYIWASGKNLLCKKGDFER